MVKLEKLLNKVTMYRLVLWGLRILFSISWILSIIGVLPYGVIRPLISISILIAVCFGANYLFAKIYKADTNSESSNITAIILYFIFQPPKNVNEAIYLSIAGFVAIASKYVITYKQRHIFNPAAFGAFAVGLPGLLQSRWWVGSREMFVFVLILSFLVTKKIRRLTFVVSFIITASLISILRSDLALTQNVSNLLLSYPIIFFAGVMLTEPITMPARNYLQISYGVIIGLLFSSGLNVGSVYMNPEIALLIGNLIFFAIFRRIRQPLKLIEVNEIADTIFEYRFKPLVPINFYPGQYLEVTLPMKKMDQRGNRRTFTISSSPTEKDITFGIKQEEQMSAFKESLLKLDKGSVISANNLAGDLLLPENLKTKLVFIAGGIGITPFRSMLKHMIDNNQHRNIYLFYAVNDPKQIAYKDVINEAKEYGLKVIYVLNSENVSKNWSGETGYMTSHIIAKHVLDYKDRVFYVSGPDAMVQANKAIIKELGISNSNIKTDYFSGY